LGFSSDSFIPYMDFLTWLRYKNRKVAQNQKLSLKIKDNFFIKTLSNGIDVEPANNIFSIFVPGQVMVS